MATMTPTTRPEDRPTADRPPANALDQEPCRVACPVCGGPLVEIRAKLTCRRCRAIVETCCEGGRG
jgi:hypothetical protein